ncbi:MAG: Tim44 domain-containing protein [Betaproteobacteria bacterium]|nr:Tim44 domain-containing protein [Betaproteobacteria bacterium]
MKRFLLTLAVGVLSLGLTLGDAEAKRLGGGKSSGVQRESVTQKQAATPAPNNAAAAPAPAAPKRNWMGPLAGLAAGLGIAALLSHFGMGEGLANFLLVGLLVVAGVFAFKFLFRRKETSMQPPDAMRYAGVGGPGMAPPMSDPGLSSGATPAAPVAQAAPQVPAGFDTDGFLRVAKLNFVRLQASNDARNLDDIREFVSPEMFAEIKLQIDERGATEQHTDVVTLNADLLEVVTEGSHHLASVRFGGMIREDAGSAATPFSEVWNLSKPVDGNKGWTIVGIQQLG